MHVYVLTALLTFANIELFLFDMTCVNAGKVTIFGILPSSRLTRKGKRQLRSH